MTEQKQQIDRQKYSPLIQIVRLHKTYNIGGNAVHALSGISLNIHYGEFVAITGPSGSGKSTFMNMIGCLDSPSSGTYFLKGMLVSRMNADNLATMRNHFIGFIFQGFHLLPHTTALQNVTLPLMYAGVSRAERESRASNALKMVGLAERFYHYPAQLSGGQQQRVAIARALVNRPALLLADEPTGNLDSQMSVEIMTILQKLNQHGMTIVLVTHEADIASYAQRRIVFRDGKILQDAPQNEIVETTRNAET